MSVIENYANRRERPSNNRINRSTAQTIRARESLQLSFPHAPGSSPVWDKSVRIHIVESLEKKPGYVPSLVSARRTRSHLRQALIVTGKQVSALHDGGTGYIRRARNL